MSEEIQKRLDSLKKTMNKYGRYIEELEKDIAILKDVVSSNESIKDKFKKSRF